MTCAQITACQPRTAILCVRKNVYHEFAPKFNLPNSAFSSSTSAQTRLLKLKITSSSNSRRSSPVCLSKSGDQNEGTPWKALEKTLGNLTRRQSIEDVLKQQIEKKEFYQDKDGGGGPPRGGGGNGGGGGSGGGAGGPEEEGILDEVIQVVLATLGFIFLYVYIITGEELLKLLKDYIKYVFKGTESVRLKRVMNQLRGLREGLTRRKVEEEDPFWLEKTILSTTTWYDSPQKDRQIYDALWAEQQQQQQQSFSEEEDEDDDDHL